MSRPLFEVIAPGLLTTVQDAGRKGFQKFGVSPNGALDMYSYRMANFLVGNRDEAALELTLVGPTLKVLASATVAVCGGDLSPSLNGSPAPRWESFVVREGDVLSFGKCRGGSRAYLAVSGGLDVKPVMGSRSTDLLARLGGLGGRPLKRGDVLYCREAEPAPPGRCVPPEYIPEFPSEVVLRVVPGPQDDHFSPKGLETFFSSTYEVTSDSDRMGCRLEGPAIEHLGGADIISDGVPLGAVQVPKHGRPIILLAGRQTVGGYAKIAVVITPDVDRVAQLKPGDRVRFQRVSLEKAQRELGKYLGKMDPGIIRQRSEKVSRYIIKINGRRFETVVEELS